jgi:hypothetical protein
MISSLGDIGGAVRVRLAVLDDHLEVRTASELAKAFEDETVGLGKGG